MARKIAIVSALCVIALFLGACGQASLPEGNISVALETYPSGSVVLEGVELCGQVMDLGKARQGINIAICYKEMGRMESFAADYVAHLARPGSFDLTQRLRRLVKRGRSYECYLKFEDADPNANVPRADDVKTARFSFTIAP